MKLIDFSQDLGLLNLSQASFRTISASAFKLKEKVTAYILQTQYEINQIYFKMGNKSTIF
jgi:hypothetical protein